MKQYLVGQLLKWIISEESGVYHFKIRAGKLVFTMNSEDRIQQIHLFATFSFTSS